MSSGRVKGSKNPDPRLLCEFAKEIEYGDIKCRLRSTIDEVEYCEYGKGICKFYKELEGKK